MFFTLLIVTFLVALLTSALVARLFGSSIRSILDRIVSPELSAAWYRYLIFAMMVVGVSGGVRLYELREFTRPRGVNETMPPLALNAERWTLEVYATIISALQRIAVLLFVFFLVALFAYVIIRVFERIEGRREMRELRERREARDASSDRGSRGERIREERSIARRDVRREAERRTQEGTPVPARSERSDSDRPASRERPKRERPPREDRPRTERPTRSAGEDESAGDTSGNAGGSAGEGSDTADSPARRRRRRTTRRDRPDRAERPERSEDRSSADQTPTVQSPTDRGVRETPPSPTGEGRQNPEIPRGPDESS